MRIFAQDLAWPYWLIAVAVFIIIAVFNLIEVCQATHDKTRRWQVVLGLWFLWGTACYVGMGGWPLREPPHEVIGAVLAIVAFSITGWVLSRIKES